MCFCVWKRGKTCRRCSGREQNQGRPLFSFSFLFVWRVLGAFYSLSTSFKVKGRHLQNAMDWVDLDTPINILTSCFWKGMDLENNSWIESYGSQNIVMHRSVCYLDFWDISAILTPILTINSCWNENLIIFVIDRPQTEWPLVIEINLLISQVIN